MNIHEHQAKQILKKYGATVPEGVFALSVDELVEKAKSLNTKKYVLKAQIHAGGRGKAGGVKILDTIEELSEAAKELMGKTLVTHQTGPEGREVKRLYVEESSNIDKEFYLSCLVDRASSKIAFISSDQGGMDIEEVASNTPEKIITTKVDINNINEKTKELLVFKPIAFIFDNLDSNRAKKSAPIFISESFAKFYYSAEDERKKEEIKNQLEEIKTLKARFKDKEEATHLEKAFSQGSMINNPLEFWKGDDLRDAENVDKIRREGFASRQEGEIFEYGVQAESGKRMNKSTEKIKSLNDIASPTSKQLTEITISKKLYELRSLEETFICESFATISAFKDNGAIIHYKADKSSDKKIDKDGLYLIDSGAHYLEGTTDTTRTIKIGKVSEEMINNYTLVLKGHIAIATAIFPKTTKGREIDTLARKALWSEGKDYAHGTGHGVGCLLSVHEGPISISKHSKYDIKQGMVISNEPGYYKNGEYGIRIENLVFVKKVKKKICFENLTLAPIEKDLINFNRYSSVFSLIGFASIWKQGLSRPHPRHLYSIGGDSHSFQIKLDAFCTLQTQFKIVLI